MRVLYFSRDYTTHDLRFLTRLATSPYEVYYLRLENDGIPYETRAIPQQVTPIDWAGGRHPAKTLDDWFHLMPDFEEIVESVRPNLIHAGPVQSCGFMTALLGFRPFLVMSWGSDLLVDSNRNAQWEWLTRYTLSRADMFVCDSTTVRNKAQSFVTFSDAQIVQFPWGIDLQPYQSDEKGKLIRKQLGWGNCCVVLSTRAWEELYGIQVLLESFRQAKESNPNLRLILMATGSKKNWVQSYILQHKLQEAIYCPGQVPHVELVNYFHAADIYISCAHSDGTSISLLEALAAGLPVIVTDIPSNREWVTPNVNGWLGVDNDAPDFAQKLAKASRLSESERANISQCNRAIAMERADWNRNIEKLLNSYAQLLGTGCHTVG